MQTTFTLQINHTTIQQKDQAKGSPTYLWQQARLETTYPHEKETNGSKNQRPILAHRKEIH
jgi:hypothetical protein